jgi:hypothetical protein
MTRPLNASLASVTVAGRSYPLVTAVACKVCRSPARTLAEEQILSGQPWVGIVEALPEDTGLTARNLKAHLKNGHIPIYEAAVREHLDRHADRRGKEMEPSIESLANHLDFVKGVVTRANARLMAGVAQPTVREGLAASELLARLVGVETFTEADATEAFIAYHETVRDVFDDKERLLEYGRRLAAHPTLQRMKDAYDARQAW